MRLFGTSGNALDVAIDHGMFGRADFLTGIESVRDAVTTVARARPDAIQLTAGQARHLQSIPGRDRPALVMRLDVANVYGTHLPDLLYNHVAPGSVETAIRADAACVVLNLFDVPGREEVRDACIRSVQATRAECEHYAMPLMVEPLVAQANVGRGYEANGDIDKILPLVRQAVELGADVIKCDPTDNLEDFHRVVEVADVPVLVRGGSKVAEDVLLERTRTVMKQGARGVVYGRNIVQHSNPNQIVAAIMDILHPHT